MPRKKVPCPLCSQPMSATSKTCRDCSQPYHRTRAHREAMSAALRGRPSPTKGKRRPGHSKTMREWWTPERREAKRQEMLKRNPFARYHGLSAKRAAQLVKDAGLCSRCGGDGSESRLGVHHRDRDKHNQMPENLEILCHRCHMQDHAKHGETGWQVYHRKRKTSQD
jgi:5-methylcytosine-specific restriction endonuclease McrA